MENLSGRYIVFSDVQGNYVSLNRFFKVTEKITKKGYVCLGDIVQNGDSFDDNRCIDLIRQQNILCVRGNHENKQLDDSKVYKINIDYVRKLPKFLSIKNVLLFHSSLVTEGKRLITGEELKEEAEHINMSFPDTNFAFFGHTHTRGVYSYNRKSVKRIDYNLGKKVALSDDLYLINPGGIGLWHSLEQTFGIIDFDQRNLFFLKLEDAEVLSRRARIVNAFDSRWMPSLSEDSIGWFIRYLEQDLPIITEFQKDDELLLEIVSILKSFDKNENIDRFSGNLAHCVSKLRRTLEDLFETKNPIKSRVDLIEIREKVMKL